VGPDVVVVDLHSGTELVCADLVGETADHFRPLPEGAVQPLHDVVVGLGLEVLQPEVRVLDECGPVEELRLDRLLVRLKPIGHNHVRADGRRIFGLLERFPGVLDLPLLRHLTGQEVPGLRVHDVPDPLVVPLLILFLEEDRHLIGVPDVAHVHLVLLRVLSEEFQVLLDPAENRGVNHANLVELLEVIDDLPVGQPLEVQVQGQGDCLRCVLHAVEPEVAGEPAATLLAPVDLHLPALVLPLAPADEVHTLAVGAGEPVVGTLLFPLGGVLLHIVFQLERENWTA